MPLESQDECVSSTILLGPIELHDYRSFGPWTNVRPGPMQRRAPPAGAPPASSARPGTRGGEALQYAGLLVADAGRYARVARTRVGTRSRARPGASAGPG